MPTGYVTAFFLFKIGDTIDLGRVAKQIDASTTTRLLTKPSAPTYLQYQQPPLVIDASAVGAGDVDGFRARVKAFDYGVLSVALTRPLPESWNALVDGGLEWHDNPRLAAAAERLARALLSRLAHAVTRPQSAFLDEDYLVFTILADHAPESADTLLSTRGALIAQLLRGEHEALSLQEREEVLRHRISYYSTDVVITTWSSALIYDTSAGASGVLEILEFANSQLLEFRSYDQLLDSELGRIYARLQSHSWRQALTPRRYARAARHVHSLFIDVNELTDRTENALKIVGDVYAARVFALTAARLGLDQWKGNVREKLKTVDDIYRFAIERTSMRRGEFLELVVVVLILLEIVLLMH